jgi:NAD(P)-dependent dehydrogenase (short-subunit alcohol dehydrogenase family)
LNGVLVYEPATPGVHLAERLRARGLTISVFRGPLGFGDETEALVAEARREAGSLAGLVTIAPAIELEPLDELEPPDWLARFRAWVEEPFALAQAWLRDVLSRGEPGRWVAVTTSLGTQPYPSA